MYAVGEHRRGRRTRRHARTHKRRARDPESRARRLCVAPAASCRDVTKSDAGFGVVLVDDVLRNPTTVGDLLSFTGRPFSDGLVLFTIDRGT